MSCPARINIVLGMLSCKKGRSKAAEMPQERGIEWAFWLAPTLNDCKDDKPEALLQMEEAQSGQKSALHSTVCLRVELRCLPQTTVELQRHVIWGIG